MPSTFGDAETGYPSGTMLYNDGTMKGLSMSKDVLSLFYYPVVPVRRTGIAQSIKRLATDWTVRGSNPSGGEIFRTRPDRSCGSHRLLYSGYWVSFLGGKAAGAWR